MLFVLCATVLILLELGGRSYTRYSHVGLTNTDLAWIVLLCMLLACVYR